jgi:hypothetical protein
VDGEMRTRAWHVHVNKDHPMANQVKFFPFSFFFLTPNQVKFFPFSFFFDAKSGQVRSTDAAKKDHSSKQTQ